jgi:hypothetical protein
MSSWRAPIRLKGLPYVMVWAFLARTIRSLWQRHNTENTKQIFPEKEYLGLSSNFHIHASVSDLYIPTIGLPILLEEICRPILGLYKPLPEKDYISGIFVAVYTANEGPVRIQYKCLVPIYVFPEMKLCSLLISKTELYCSLSQFLLDSYICERFI